MEVSKILFIKSRGDDSNYNRIQMMLMFKINTNIYISETQYGKRVR
jgi:hypothetical protein